MKMEKRQWNFKPPFCLLMGEEEFSERTVARR